jgi:hypothetical protein
VLARIKPIGQTDSINIGIIDCVTPVVVVWPERVRRRLLVSMDSTTDTAELKLMRVEEDRCTSTGLNITRAGPRVIY